MGIYEVGCMVKVLPPFDKAFPDVYEISGKHERGVCVIAGDRDFDPRYLEIVSTGEKIEEFGGEKREALPVKQFERGQKVRLLSPFDKAFPDVYEVSGANEKTGDYSIAVSRVFNPIYLEAI